MPAAIRTSLLPTRASRLGHGSQPKKQADEVYKGFSFYVTRTAVHVWGTPGRCDPQFWLPCSTLAAARAEVDGIVKRSAR